MKANSIRFPSLKLRTEHQLKLLRLLPDGIGSRDQLPYTAEFDRIHRQFSKFTGTRLNVQEFWRVMSRVAKHSRKPRPVFESAPLGGLDPRLVKLMQF